MITDESITVGKQKLLLQLGVSARHPGRPLNQSDVEVIGMAVRPSWKSDDVKTEVEDTAKDIGHAPEYVISDNGGNLCKACRDAGIPHHCDISHSLGLILKKHFGDSPDFKELTRLMEKKRLSYHLTDKAVLLPPKQRAIARFMNCSLWVRWAGNTIRVYDTLPEDMKDAYSFLLKYKTLIMELAAIMECMNYVEYRCKHDGLSKELAQFLVWRITKSLITSKGRTQRMLKVGLDMFQYLQKECELLKEDRDVHIISSDIIESCFGLFKSTKSPDKLCGVTKHVLVLPLALKFKSRTFRISFDYKKTMENTHYADLKKWKEENLAENPMMRRRKIYRNAS